MRRWYSYKGYRYLLECNAWDERGNPLNLTLGDTGGCVDVDVVSHRQSQLDEYARLQKLEVERIRIDEEVLDARHYAHMRGMERKRESALAEQRLVAASAPPALPKPAPAPNPQPNLRDERIIADALAVLRREYRASGHDTKEIDLLITSRKAAN